MHVPMINGLIAAGAASAEEIDARCWQSVKNPLRHLLTKHCDRVPRGCVSLVNARAMTSGDDNHVAGGECRRIENRERQRFAGVGDDLGGCVAQGYLTENAQAAEAWD